ncbi:MAG: hypothetical protein KDB53_19530, partial [Planctomycetes bacterium]|nr:hypothetical protein [Planctomycetota bacterium]
YPVSPTPTCNLEILVSVVQGRRYRLLKSDPPLLPGTPWDMHVEDALNNWRWVVDPSLSTAPQPVSGVITVCLDVPDSANFFMRWLSDPVLFVVEDVGDDPSELHYTGAFTRPVGRVMVPFVGRSFTGGFHGKNLISAPLTQRPIYGGNIKSRTATEIVLDRVPSPSPFTGLNNFPPSPASPLINEFPYYVAIVTRDISRDSGSPTIRTTPSDRKTEGTWWPVVGFTTTHTTDDTLILDTSYSGVVPPLIPVGSTIEVRRTTSLQDLFDDPITVTPSTNYLPAQQTIVMRRPGLKELTITRYSAADYRVSLNGAPEVAFGDGSSIRVLPDEAVMVDIFPTWTPLNTGCSQTQAVGQIGWVPTGPINGYFHPNADLTGLEFKGVNYPVGHIKLDSATSGDPNWSGLVDSGFLGPDPVTTPATFSNDSYFEFDDVWRLMCGMLDLKILFPVLGTNDPNTVPGIAMWGQPVDPPWSSTWWAGNEWNNDKKYWLARKEHWSAYTTDIASPLNSNLKKRRGHTQDYALSPGHGIAAHLADSRSTVQVWVRPLPYPGGVSHAQH